MKSSRGGTRLDLSSIAAASMSRSVAPAVAARGSPGSPACPRDRAPGAPGPVSSQRSGSTRREIDRDDLVARGARIGHERAVRLGAALIAQEHLGLLVAHEERRRCAELGRDAAEHRAFGDREQPRARPGELEDHGRVVLRFDALRRPRRGPRRRSSSATSRAQTKGRMRPERRICTLRGGRSETVPEGERLPELPGGNHQGEHAGAADRGEARIVGDREPRRGSEALEVHRRRESDAGPRDRGCRPATSRAPPTSGRAAPTVRRG